MKKRTFLILAVAVALLTASCNMTGLERTAPKTAEEYQARGLEYLENGDYDSAIANYTHAIRLNPNDAIAFLWRGDAYLDKGDYNSAIADYETALQLLDPEDIFVKMTEYDLERARQAKGG